MPDFRSYFSPAPGTDPERLEQILLDPGEARHLVAVNRARPGDPVTVFDGTGREWTCRLESASRQEALLRVEAFRHAPRPLACDLTLAQALPKGKAMESIVRKATEIGAAAIRPLATARSEVRLEQEERRESKRDRWIATAIEAAKQCGNPFLPEIHPLASLTDFLAAPPCELRIVASLQPQAMRLRALLRQLSRRPASVCCLIGPEGDFSDEEYEAALDAGFHPVSLGSLVLRSDTAAQFMLSVLAHEFGN